MDYEGVVGDVSCMQARATVILRDWEYTQFRFWTTRDEWQAFTDDCYYFTQQLFVAE